MSASSDEVRAARAFLFSRGMQARDIPPRKFANAAKELSLSFSQLLSFIGRLYDAGQNQSQFRLDVIAKEASKAR